MIRVPDAQSDGPKRQARHSRSCFRVQSRALGMNAIANHCEGLIDLPQINVIDRSSPDPVHKLLRRRNGGCEPCGVLCMARMANDTMRANEFQPTRLGPRPRSSNTDGPQHASEIEGGVGGPSSAVFLKAGRKRGGFCRAVHVPGLSSCDTNGHRLRD